MPAYSFRLEKYTKAPIQNDGSYGILQATTCSGKSKYFYVKPVIEISIDG